MTERHGQRIFSASKRAASVLRAHWVRLLQPRRPGTEPDVYTQYSHGSGRDVGRDVHYGLRQLSKSPGLRRRRYSEARCRNRSHTPAAPLPAARPTCHYLGWATQTGLRFRATRGFESASGRMNRPGRRHLGHEQHTARRRAGGANQSRCRPRISCRCSAHGRLWWVLQFRGRDDVRTKALDSIARRMGAAVRFRSDYYWPVDSLWCFNRASLKCPTGGRICGY